MCQARSQECKTCRFDLYCNTAGIVIRIKNNGLAIAVTGGGYCKSNRNKPQE